MKKTLCERKHAKKRFNQRFGRKLKRLEYRQIIHDIRMRKFDCIKKQSRRVNLYFGKIFDSNAVIVYDTKRCEIITFLKPEMIDNYAEVV